MLSFMADQTLLAPALASSRASKSSSAEKGAGEACQEEKTGSHGGISFVGDVAPAASELNMNAKQPLPWRFGSSTSLGSKAREGEGDCDDGGRRPTATAHITPFIGTLPAFNKARVLALIMAATRRGSAPFSFPLIPGERLCRTSCSSERGLTVRRSDGTRSVRIVDAKDFASVPGILESGRSIISSVARDGCSRANRTSMGPERDARASVSPGVIASQRLGARKANP